MDAIISNKSRQFWLVKQEPNAYAWSDFVCDCRTDWTGVRNFQARNHLRAMRTGDGVLFYHSGAEKQIVGSAQVARAAFPDPTATDGKDWLAVTLAPERAFAHPVTLAQIRAAPELADIALLRQSRLSVVPLTPAEFEALVKLGGADD